MPDAAHTAEALKKYAALLRRWAAYVELDYGSDDAPERVDYDDLAKTIDDAVALIDPPAKAVLNEVVKLRRALGFARSVIKSGEPWTETCEQIIGGALADAGGEG